MGGRDNQIRAGTSFVEAEGVCLCISFLPAAAPSLPPSLPNQKPDLHFPLQKVPSPSHDRRRQVKKKKKTNCSLDQAGYGEAEREKKAAVLQLKY